MRGDPRVRRTLGRLLRLVHLVRATGLERVPQSGRVVLAMNHSGVRGALVFESLIARDVVFFASARFLRFPKVREFAQKLGLIFVSQADLLDLRLFDESENAMRGGSLLGVMVPGRQTTQIEGVPKRGAVYLAYRLRATLLPVTIVKRGLSIRISVGSALPPPASLRAGVLDATFAEVCNQLGLVP